MKLYRDATVKDGLRVVNNLRPEDRSEMEGIGVSILSLPFGVLISEHAVYFFSKEGKAAGLAVAHGGWVGIKTYNDNAGNLRVKSEVLVAGSSITADSTDDSFFKDA